MATYVCSDIHGLSQKYYSLLDRIDCEHGDTLIILGDVIDRGPDGFEILMDALKRENVHLLMGNHEYMMWEVLEINKGEIPNDISVLNWLLNGGATTIAAYNKASLEDQFFICQSLRSLPYAFTDIVVNDRHFYLCHTAPGKAKDKKVLYWKDIKDPMNFVWERMNPQGPFLENKTIIAGHTIVLNYHSNLTVFSDTNDLKTAHYIDIDCGCAMNDESSKLACLCLDTMEVEYF